MNRGILAIVFLVYLAGFVSACFCGNGILEEGEECDDGNLIDGDGCSNVCKIEEKPPEPPICGDGICNGEETCSTCSEDCGICPPPQPVCGNGILESGEECDDGNLVDGDGCSNVCKIENHEEEENKKEKSTEFAQFCEPNWKCSAWSECKDESKIMTRSCVDTNHCIFSYNKPAESMACEQKALIEESQADYNLFIGLGITALLLIILIILLLKRKS